MMELSDERSTLQMHLLEVELQIPMFVPDPPEMNLAAIETPKEGNGTTLSYSNQA